VPIEVGKKYDLVIVSASAMGLLAVSLYNLPLTNKQIEEAKELGGSDSGNYRRIPDPHYFDKGSHKARHDYYHTKGNT